MADDESPDIPIQVPFPPTTACSEEVLDGNDGLLGNGGLGDIS